MMPTIRFSPLKLAARQIFERYALALFSPASTPAVTGANAGRHARRRHFHVRFLTKDDAATFERALFPRR